MTSRRETKRSGPIEVKAADRGEVTAIFATLNTVDHDGDVTLPGAFEDGAELFLSEWNHSAMTGHALPVGKGRIRTDGDRVIVDAQYFVDTGRGRHAFEVVRKLAGTVEWSYGFSIIEDAPGDRPGVARYLKRLEVFEASPVHRGAGIGTGTVSTRAADAVAFEMARYCRDRHFERQRRQLRAIREGLAA